MKTDVASWEALRFERDRDLASPHGWLSLTAMTFLGSEPSSVEAFPGLWYADDAGAHGLFSASDEVKRAGEPLEGTYSVVLGEDESVIELAHGSAMAEVGVRGGRYMVRVRDAEAATLTEFRGVPAFDYDPAYVVSGEFRPFEQPVEVPISTAHPAVSGVAHVVGEVRFAVDGRECALRVQGDAGGLTALFHDRTNGVSTANWRFVSFDAPQQDSEVPGLRAGRVVIDFNRALNFPAAFTPFGTCPMPPVGNDLPVVIKAGEKRP